MTSSRHSLPLLAAILLLGGALLPLAQAQPPESRAVQPVTAPTSEPTAPSQATPTPEPRSASRPFSLSKAPVISSDTVAIDINNTPASDDDQVLLGDTIE